MKKLTNRLISLVLAFLMLMSGMPTALAEEVETLPGSTEKTTPTDLSETSEPDAADIPLTDIEQAPVEEMPEVPVDEEVSVEATDQTEQSVTNDPSESSEPTPQTVREFIDANGYAYAQLRKDGSIFAEEVMQTLIYTTNQAGSAILCTGYTQTGLMTVWLMSADREIITGWMEEACLEDAAITESQAAALMQQGEPAEADTPAGKHPVYEVNGNKPVSEAEPIVDVPSEEIPAEYPPAEEPAVEEPPVNELLTEDTPSEETPSEDVPLGDLPVEEIPTDEHPTEQTPVVSVPDDEHPIDEQPVEDQPIEELPTEDLPSEELPIEELPAEEQPSEELLTEELPAEELPIEEEMPQPEPLHQIGDYLAVTTDTRVFEQVGEYEELEFCDWMGYFMRDAIVQVLAIQTDEYARTWYQVEYLFGAEGADGGWNWMDTANLWILADEALPTEETHLTVTDYAFWQKPDFNSGIMLLAATPMPGFSLRNISVNLGGFYAWQSGLHGSSGRDSAYLQIAKSAGHGTIYATPHYLEGYTVFCLEHTMDGPGEGNGSTPTGPYVLVDMDTYCNTSTGDGVTGYRFSEPTMHAIGWILRHTYPFMVLDRSDKDNNSWSRVAGQFAIRQVIRDLEGAQFVRSYWDMDNFYRASGQAPAVYLEYARWLAENGIARSRITGKINLSNQSLSVSGTGYVGSVTVTTDADLIRIPRSAGTITGNSGGSDSSYYYARSGDTIRVTSSQSRFSISMESVSSDSEEANFLIGIPSAQVQKVIVPTYGAPYALQSASVTFELSSGEVVVTKKSTDGILLTGTVFELLNASGSVIKTATTDDTGKVTFSDLEPGSYKVREKTPSQGYKLAAVTTQNVTVTAGITTPVTFTNERITGKIRVVKTDSVTRKPLPGATFTLTRLTCPASDHATDVGRVVATIITNANGIAETDVLPWGQYKIVETGVPDGYLDGGYTTTVTIN